MGSREEMGRTLDPRLPSYLYAPEVRGGTRESLPASTGSSQRRSLLLLRRLLRVRPNQTEYGSNTLAERWNNDVHR